MRSDTWRQHVALLAAAQAQGGPGLPLAGSQWRKELKWGRCGRSEPERHFWFVRAPDSIAKSNGRTEGPLLPRIGPFWCFDDSHFTELGLSGRTGRHTRVVCGWPGPRVHANADTEAGTRVRSRRRRRLVGSPGHEKALLMTQRGLPFASGQGHG